jgi:AraC-like DNA-binding protein
MLSAKITQMLSSSGNNSPTMEAIADTLNVTSRTLQRKLSTEDTNFREILNAVKIERAIYYMTKKKQPPKQVAYLVGFKDASSFTKAFKRYTGKTPSDYLHNNCNPK